VPHLTAAPHLIATYQELLYNKEKLLALGDRWGTHERLPGARLRALSSAAHAAIAIYIHAECQRSLPTSPLFNAFSSMPLSLGPPCQRDCFPCPFRAACVPTQPQVGDRDCREPQAGVALPLSQQGSPQAPTNAARPSRRVASLGCMPDHASHPCRIGGHLPACHQLDVSAIVSTVVC
jgi:hypothetical protein